MIASIRTVAHPLMTAAVCLLTLCTVSGKAQTPSAVEKIASVGSFTDKTGGKHTWQINDSHALLWDNAPYIPVGGTFAPRSLLTDAPDAWESDKKALDALKAKGIHDLIVWPGKPLPNVPPAALQRLLDYLDTSAMVYGLAFGPGLTTPLTGNIVRPATYRYDSRDSLTAQWLVTDADSALYVLVDASDKENKILRGGGVVVHDPQVSVPIEMPSSASRAVALLYPHKSLVPKGNGSLPDIWTGFDGYRDQLLTCLGKIKFGQGFRFFLDPLARQLGMAGETDYLIPDSPAFLVEFEAFLMRRYPRFDELKQNWGLSESDAKTYGEAARLVPLWANDRGAPYFVEPATGKLTRILDARQSHWWDDFLQYRRETLLYTMNALANVLKHEVADVPVVYTWTQTDPMFLNNTRDGGFDGLSVTAPAGDTTLTGRVFGPAYSEAEQSARTMWCIASQVGTGTGVKSAPADNAPKTAANPVPYASRNALFYDLDQLRRVGYKGFFAEGLQKDETMASAANWLAAPDALEWLREYGSRVSAENNAARYAPHTLYYPQLAPGPAHTGFIPGLNGVLWLAAFLNGETLDWWPGYRGYVVKEGATYKQTVLVSLQGTRRTKFVVPVAKSVQAFAADGSTIPVKILDKSHFEIVLDDKPVIIESEGQRLFPVQAAEDALVQLSALYQQSVAAKIPAVEQQRSALDRATFAMKQKDYETAFNYSRTALDDLTYTAAPYIWLEGENPYRELNTFNEVASNVEASNRQYLRLSTPNPPGRFGYGVRYLFDVPNDGKYNLWLAGTVPGPNTSPIKWRINTEPEQDPLNPKPQGPLYLNERFGWIMLGTAQLKRGPQQSLTIYVTDRAQNPPEFIFSIDAILLTQNGFAPNGTVRPNPVDAATLRLFRKNKRDDEFGF